MTYIIFTALIGLAIGSFINVLIYRIPEGKNVAFPASHCPKCENPLKPWHNLPLLSWILLGGKCAYCKTKISIQYPLIELLSALLFLGVYFQLGWTLSGLFTALTFVLLLALSIIDWRYKAVPDSLNLLALTFAILAFPQDALVDSLLFAGGFVLLRFYLSYYLFKKFSFLEKRVHSASWRKHYHPLPLVFEAMGEADIIVAATIGAILGIPLGLFAIFLSALLTLPVALMRRNIDAQTPYVPFLSMALITVFLMSTQVNTLLKFLYE